MERRTFIKSSVLASTSLMVPNFLKASSLNLNTAHDKNLVVIQLSGGNDGLNTIVPFRSDIYHQLRPKVSLKSTSTLPLNDELSINNNLPEFKKLYDEGHVSIINSVGYPNPNRSHFRSLDIWHSASSSDKYVDSGWLGRYLDNYGEGVAPVIEVDDSLSLALKGNSRFGLAVSNPGKFYRSSKDPFFEALGKSTNKAELGISNLDYLYKTMIDTQSAASYINEKSKLWTNKTTFPSTAIGRKLKQTAQFINARLSTKVYYLEHGGFDTHAGQLNTQSRLLNQFDASIAAFVQELKAGDSFDNTIIMIFSEFGRRVKENGSGGTDHGTANSVFIIGNKLKTAGMLNNYPSLDNLDANGDLIFSIDFRSVYATILNRWMGVSDKLILGEKFKYLNFI